MVVVAEGSRRTTFLLLEDAVEVADIVETATVADFSHTGMRIDKKAGSIAQADVDDVVRDGLACTSTEEAAEGSRCHAGYVGKCLEAYLLLEILVDMFLDSTNTAAFGLVLHVGKRFAGQ